MQDVLSFLYFPAFLCVVRVNLIWNYEWFLNIENELLYTFVVLHCSCAWDLSFYEVLHFLDWLGFLTIASIKLAVRNFGYKILMLPCLKWKHDELRLKLSTNYQMQGDSFFFWDFCEEITEGCTCLVGHWQHCRRGFSGLWEQKTWIWSHGQGFVWWEEWLSMTFLFTFGC